jgi:hypothetical protein
MIISGILKQAFEGLYLTFDNYNQYNEVVGQVAQAVNFGFGDENELVRFISSRSNMQNFPLIWYVKPNYTRDLIQLDRFNVNAKFVLMMSTNAKLYNEQRALINYSNVLEPLAIEFYKRLRKSKLVEIVPTISREFDETQYGLDVYRESSQPTKSATKLYVDAKAIELELVIKKNCRP